MSAGAKEMTVAMRSSVALKSPTEVASATVASLFSAGVQDSCFPLAETLPTKPSIVSRVKSLVPLAETCPTAMTNNCSPATRLRVGVGDVAGVGVAVSVRSTPCARLTRARGPETMIARPLERFGA